MEMNEVVESVVVENADQVVDTDVCQNVMSKKDKIVKAVKVGAFVIGGGLVAKYCVKPMLQGMFGKNATGTSIKARYEAAHAADIVTDGFKEV